MKKAVLLLVLLLCFGAEAKKIGIWSDSRIGVMAGVTNSLAKAGWEVVFIGAERRVAPPEGLTPKEAKKLKLPLVFESQEELSKYDVLYFPGGWGRYYFPSYKARIAIIRYVASGGNVLLCGYRGGYPRTANRPMFPEVAEVYNRLSSGWIFPSGDSDLAKSFGGRPVTAGSGDHMALKIGPVGNVFAENSGDPVGAFGNVGLGKVIVYGGHLSYTPGDETSESNENILFAMLDYFSSSGKIDAGEALSAADAAERNFYIRENMWTMALDDRGPDSKAGFIPVSRDSAVCIPESLAFKLDYFAGFLSDAEAAKCREMSARIKVRVNKANLLADDLKKQAQKYLKSLSLEELKGFSASKSQWSASELSSRFNDIVQTNETAEIESFIRQITPKVRAVKRVRIEKELAEDLKTVPALVVKMGSVVPKDRYDAAKEIGRIQPTDKAAISALARLLSDPVEQVRTQAAISLGWMQCKDEVAIEALVKNTASSCIWDVRRAVQALGNIGLNTEFIRKAIVKVLYESDDADAMQLACLALGHIKAGECVPELAAIANGASAVELHKALDIRETSIIALGYIGDRSVVEDIKKIQSAYGGMNVPKTKKGRPFTNLFSYGSHATRHCRMGLYLAGEQALEMIAQGGRKQTGVRQSLERRSKDLFYAITGNCQALAGRIETSASVFKDKKYMLAHLKEAGFTGVHTAWGLPLMSTNNYFRMLEEACDLDLIWIDTLSSYSKAGKSMTEYRMERTTEYPCLSGSWAEETWPSPGISPKRFIGRMDAKFGDWRNNGVFSKEEVSEIERIGYSNEYSSIDFSAVCQPEKRKEENFSSPWNGNLRSAMLEIDGDEVTSLWKESQDYLHGCRMGYAHTFVVSTLDPVRNLYDNQALKVVDSIGLESYQSFGRSSAYYMQRYRDGEGRSTMSELYNWYCPSPKHAKLGFWQNAIHSKCYFNFALCHLFKYSPNHHLWVWSKDRWNSAREVFRRVAANKEYYKIVPSASNIAVLFSGASMAVTRENALPRFGVPLRVEQNAMAIWAALNQIQRPADVVYADDVSFEKLSKYKIVYLPDSKFLGAKGIDSIRKFVREGGVLIAEGGASLFDGRSLQMRRNYALNDVFGVDYVKTDFLDADHSDTFCYRSGEKVSAYKFVTDFSRRFRINDPIHRDFKPEKSIRRAKVLADAAECLPSLKQGEEIEFDAALGIDDVKATSAKRVAEFENGLGAIYVNEFGKGRCYFLASQYPLMGHVTSEWEMMPNRWDFWKNVREMLKSIVDSSYARTSSYPAVDVKNVAQEVEVTVDDHGSRYVVHLLDYNVKSKGVKGAIMTVPGTRKIKRIWYPDTKTELEISDRTVMLRDFESYDLVSVEFK